ncbi:GIY-YIG nuclease family protein [Anabaena sp. CCY 9910]|uniref:GIY-YIG nuclease family protein n=1 Tax=Anabaena sp. CCY 9910 TaxID=3103870 RepID=UPI0039DF8F21
MNILTSDEMDLIIQLESGTYFEFKDWKNASVPRKATGVYTIWLEQRLIYVGMSENLYGRLNSHASGRRSGDQFCVYVADRLVLPTLSQEEIQDIAAGILLFDQLVKNYIHKSLGYRFVKLVDKEEAIQMEELIRQGKTSLQQPLLNPSKLRN